MKPNIKKLLITTATCAVVAVGLLLSRFSTEQTALAQVATPGTTPYQPNFYNTVSNYTSLMVPSNGVAVWFGPATNQNIAIRQNQGDGWLISITTSNNSSGNLTLFWDVTADGVSNHWTGTNTHFLSWTIPLVNSNTWISATNFGRDVINNFRSIYPTVVSNSCPTNNVFVNFVTETHGNQ